MMIARVIAMKRSWGNAADIQRKVCICHLKNKKKRKGEKGRNEDWF